MKIYDISRTVSPATAVWPGDEPVEVHWSARIGRDSVVNLSTIRMSVHAGTHVDAPFHYLADGQTVDRIPLVHFIGPCYVIPVHEADIISPELVSAYDLAETPRVLFKTKHSRLPDTEWDRTLVSIMPSAVDRLAEQGVLLIGTDAPSVDPVDSKTLDAHKALARNGIVNLENLVLDGVGEGQYELIALPLKVKDLDAAPVRAILIER